VNEAESQTVLNTLREHDFQDAFKKWQKPWNCAYARKGTTSKVMAASRPKISFWPDRNTSPGNYGWLFVCGEFISESVTCTQCCVWKFDGT
jgi:hypothetical protein